MTLQKDPSYIGQQFFYGAGRKKSYRQAFPYLLAAARAGDPHCQNLVGYSYDRGLGVKKDIQSAILWYRQAARNNDPEGLFNLALSYK
jgi:TPR repeat protein